MLKKLISAVLLCSVILLSLCSFTPAKAKPQVKTAAAAVDSEKVLEARFLNMLNHSFVYDDAMYDDEALLNASALAFLSFAENGFIDEADLKDYVFNMYGQIYNDLSGYNKECPKLDGKFYIIPRGYDLYSHTVLDVVNNNDGSYTVKTEVLIDYHFGETETAVCETLFIENVESQFGYNILYSEIEAASADVLSI